MLLLFHIGFLAARLPLLRLGIFLGDVEVVAVLGTVDVHIGLHGLVVPGGHALSGGSLRGTEVQREVLYRAGMTLGWCHRATVVLGLQTGGSVLGLQLVVADGDDLHLGGGLGGVGNGGK